jgi:hypothetical protein
LARRASHRVTVLNFCDIERSLSSQIFWLDLQRRRCQRRRREVSMQETAGVQYKVRVMSESDSDVVMIVTERFERRLAEDTGLLRAEMASGFGALRAEMSEGFGELRAEMIDRNAELLKWWLVFAVAQTAALTGVIALMR